MRDHSSTVRPRRLWASLSEGRPPQDGELESFAAKIWNDAYRRGGNADWQQVEIGSPTHRKSMAAALAALAPGGMLSPD